MKKTPKTRDYHMLKIIKREARGNTTAIGSQKAYSRKRKHPKRGWE